MCVVNRSMLVLALATAGLLAAVPAAGQIIYGQKPAAGLDIVATHWRLALDQDEATIDQWAFPVSAFVPLGDNFEARVYTAYSTTTVHQQGQDFDLKGLSDMRLQVNHAFAGDRALVGIGLNLPTGHKALSLTEEWAVMNLLSQSFLSFPIRNLGEGFGLNLMAGGATEWGEFRVGVNATLDLTGAYTAYLTEDDYKPGNSFNLTAGLQRELGNSLLNGDITLTTSADDKQGDVPIYSRGDQVAFHAGLAGGSLRNRYVTDATFLLRGRNAVYDPAGILLQQLKTYGNEFIVAGGFEHLTDGKWSYGPSADLRLIAGNELGLGKSTVLGLSGHLARELTPMVGLRLTLKYFTGSTHDGEIDLSGFQTWLTASGTF